MLSSFIIAYFDVLKCKAYLKGGGHANLDAEFFVPMDSLGDA